MDHKRLPGLGAAFFCVRLGRLRLFSSQGSVEGFDQFITANQGSVYKKIG